MLIDFAQWKKELAKDLAKFEIELEFSSPENLDFKEIEKFIFFSAYIIRKLLEANKLSDEFESLRFPTIEHTFIPQQNDKHLFWFDVMFELDKYYDLQNNNPTTLSTKILCNLLIHSFVFLIDDVNDTFPISFDIFFNSDHSKNKCLYRMNSNDLIEIIKSVIKDDVVSISYNYDNGTINKSKYLPDQHND